MHPNKASIPGVHDLQVTVHDTSFAGSVKIHRPRKQQYAPMALGLGSAWCARHGCNITVILDTVCATCPTIIVYVGLNWQKCQHNWEQSWKWGEGKQKLPRTFSRTQTKRAQSTVTEQTLDASGNERWNKRRKQLGHTFHTMPWILLMGLGCQFMKIFLWSNFCCHLDTLSILQFSKPPWKLGIFSSMMSCWCHPPCRTHRCFKFCFFFGVALRAAKQKLSHFFKPASMLDGHGLGGTPTCLPRGSLADNRGCWLTPPPTPYLFL